MVRVMAVYESQPDAERHEQHARLCRQVEGSTFRHGRVLGTTDAAEMGVPHSVYLVAVD